MGESASMTVEFSKKKKVNCRFLTNFMLSKKQASRLCLFFSSQVEVRISGTSLGSESCSDTLTAVKRGQNGMKAWGENAGIS